MSNPFEYGIGCEPCGCGGCSFTFTITNPCSVPPDDPIASATVEIKNILGTVVKTGTSDGSGKLVVTDLPEGVYSFKVTKGTSSWTSGQFGVVCGGEYQLRSRCAPVIRFKVNSAAAPTITSSPNLFQTATTDPVTGDIIWTLCNSSFGGPDVYPKSATFTATSFSSPGVVNPLYPSICVTTTLQCYSTIVVDLTQSYWGACYFPVQGCDQGCSHGAGPNFRGLVSKAMEAKFTSDDGRFADDEGVWIPMTGTQTGGVISWDSGSRGNSNNYMSMDFVCGYAGTCSLNAPMAPEAKRIYYSGTRVTVAGTTITYRRVSGSDQSNTSLCHNTTSPCSTGFGSGTRGCFWSDSTGLLCADYVNSASVSGFCCPTNITSGTITDSFGHWHYSLREKC